MSRYWPSQSARHVSSNSRIRRRTLASENPRSLSRWRAIRERLNSVSPVLMACGTPWTVQSVGPVAALDVAVLDVVVDEAEVVPELDGRGAGQRPGVLAGDRGVGEEAEQRPDALAARRPRAVEREVVADHLVQPVRRRVAVGDEPEDLRLGVGDEQVEVDVGRGRHRGPSVHETCAPEVADSPHRDGGIGARTWCDAGAGDATAPASTTGYAVRRGSDAAPGAGCGRASVVPSPGARPAPLHHRCHRPLALRPGGGGPRPDADHARRSASSRRSPRGSAGRPRGSAAASSRSRS